MQAISDTIERKFVDSIETSDWEIESESGWVDITHINKTTEYAVYHLTTTNCSIECADDHIVFLESGEEIFVKDLIPGDIIKGQQTSEIVLSVIKTNRFENMYDLTVTGNHTYYSQGLLHHNTQTVTAYILWYSLFNSDKTIAILANKAAAAREVLSRYQDMYEGLPKWLQQGIKTWNKGNIELENGSKIFTSATSPNACRGRAIALLYVDESAFISNTMAEGFFTSVYPTISSGTTSKIIQTSTPMGYNHWWKFWTESEKGINNFIPFRVTWDMVPGKTIEWYNEQVKALGSVKASQEIDCSFIGSSYTLVNATTLSRLQPSPPVKVTEYGLSILEEPKKDRIYVMVADTSEGVGGDYSAFTVIDITELPYTVVAKYRSNTINPLLYPSVISGAANAYNNAYVLLEINRSEQVAYILHHELEYENMLYVVRGKHGQTISAGFGGLKPNYGVATDKKVKRIGCANLKTLIEENKLLITDADIISEISTFVEKKGSYAADEGYHDDLIMTLVLFGWLTTQEYFKDLNNLNLRKLLYDMKQKEIEDQVLPIGYMIDGNDENAKGVVMDGDYWFFAEPREQ